MIAASGYKNGSNPRRVEVLADLLKTPTGKLLRRELRERAIDG